LPRFFIMNKSSRFSQLILLWLILSPLVLLSQTSISGLIADDKGKALEGANILIYETGEGTISDNLGKYNITSNAKGVVKLKVSYIGYQAIEKKLKIVAEKKSYQIDFTLLPDVYLSESVEIKAQGFEPRPRNMPGRIEMIGKAEIRSSAGQTIDQTFSSSAGVNVNRQFGIFSDGAVVSLRGQSGSDQSRTLVLVDGIPVNKSDGGSVNWNFINPDDVDHVEISKGPGSARFGNNAMGGAINIITTKPTKKFDAEARLEGGQWNTFGGKIKISGHNDVLPGKTLWYTVNGMARTSNGYINQPAETILLYDSVVVPSFLREQAVQAKAGFEPGKNQDLSLDVSFYNDKRGRGIQIYEEDGSWSSHQTWFTNARYSAKAGKYQIDSKIFGLIENYYRVNEYFSEGEYMLYDVDSRRTDVGGIINVLREAGNNHKLSAGFEAKQGKVVASDIYYTSTDKINNRGRMNTAGAFVMDEINLLNKKLLLNIGLRLDMAAFGDGAFIIEKPSYAIEYLLNFGDTAMPSNSWTALNPRISVQYSFSENTRTFISAARGFRAPVLDDLCRSGRQKYGFRLANPNLGPEYVSSLEWGLDVKLTQSWQFAVSAFYSRGKDYMYAVSTGDSVNMGYTISPVYKIQNISAVDISGIEAEITGNITENLKAFANYTWNFTRIAGFIPNTAADPDLTGKHLTDVPDHQSNAGFRFTHRLINFSVTAKYVGKRWINDRNIADVTYLLAPQYPAYFNMDVKFWKNIGQHWQADLGIENIFDETHIDDRGQKTPGRFIMAGIIWRLK